jgi:CubicO group peptidase (beta-lactamase class C family)
MLHAKEPSFDSARLNALVKETLTKLSIPGCAVAVVREGEVIHLEGYGLRDIGDPSKRVTPDTLFTIASCTKAFVAAGVAALVEEGKMNWDDPVRTHLSDFRLRDELADREVTIRDLLCHRTGIIRHDVLRFVHTWDRPEMIRRASQLKQDIPFRAGYGYNNLQYLMAAEASAKAAKSSWEELIRTRLLDPLGMKRSTLKVAEMLADDNWARPHLPRAGKIIAVNPSSSDVMAAAGGMNTSVREMTAWLQMHLNEGAFEGKRILKPKTIRTLHTPLVVIGNPTGPLAEVTNLQSYGLGWQISDYRGRRLVSHSGSREGVRALVVLLPKERVGVVALSNLHTASLPEIVCYSVLDGLLAEKKTDWLTATLQVRKTQQGQAQKQEAALLKNRKSGTRPSLAMPGYTGEFEDAAHGTMSIREDKGKLTASWGRLNLLLEHWHHDVFRMAAPNESWAETLGDRLLQFRMNKRGEVIALEYLGYEFRKR